MVAGKLAKYTGTSVLAEKQVFKGHPDGESEQPFLLGIIEQKKAKGQRGFWARYRWRVDLGTFRTLAASRLLSPSTLANSNGEMIRCGRPSFSALPLGSLKTSLDPLDHSAAFEFRNRP